MEQWEGIRDTEGTKAERPHTDKGKRKKKIVPLSHICVFVWVTTQTSVRSQGRQMTEGYIWFAGQG